MSLRTAVVGCGAISKTCHLPALINDKRIEIVALIDSNPGRTELLRQEFGLDAVVVPDLRDMPEVDFAICAVPPDIHAHVVSDLLERGIDVLCEKPLATTVRDAETMVEVARNNNRMLAVGLQIYHAPNLALAEDVLNDGLLGDISSWDLEIGFRSGWGARNEKRFDPKVVPGGVLFEAGVHWMACLWKLFGEMTVEQYMDDRLGGVEANARLRVKSAGRHGEIPGKANFSWTHTLRNRLVVTGTKGSAEIRDGDHIHLYMNTVIGGKCRTAAVAATDDEQVDLFALQLEDVIGAVRDKRAPLADGRVGVESLRIIENAYAVRKPMPQPWVTSGLRNKDAKHAD